MLTTLDKMMLTQSNIIFRVRLDIHDLDDNYLNTITGGIMNGGSSIDAESAIRRTLNFTVIPNTQSALTIQEDGMIWLNKYVHMYFGIQNIRDGEFIWYKQGKYLFTDASVTYDEANNTLQINCSDLMAQLDGSINGELTILTELPAYDEDKTTGEVIRYNVIRDSIAYVLSDLAGMTNYQIDDVGAYKGMPQYNPNYLEYRESTTEQLKDGSTQQTWNTVPYDLSFEAGGSVLSILEELVGLYYGYEQYFDVDGVYNCKLIPMCTSDSIWLDYDYIKKIFISESTTVEMNTVRNVVLVYGESYDADYFTEENITLSGSTYSMNIPAYPSEYKGSSLIAFKVPATNPSDCKVNINNLGEVYIFDESTDQHIAAGKLEKDVIYTFKLKKKYENKTNVFKLYLQGCWQAKGLMALVENEVGDTSNMYKLENGNLVPTYSKEYFQDKYNCDSVQLMVAPDSQFTCQRIRERLKVCTGGDYDAIGSDDLALIRAQWELYNTARIPDSISITTLFCPWADVNKKITYNSVLSDHPSQYIVKNISHSWDVEGNATTTWQLMRFFDYYVPDGWAYKYD